jgi:hypothetical protein
VIQGPDTIDHLHEFSIDSIISDLRQHSPDLYSLFLKIGNTRRNTCDDKGLSTEDIKAVASLCTLLNARSNRVKGLQLINLMLITRATSRQVSIHGITCGYTRVPILILHTCIIQAIVTCTLSHIGFCMSYTSAWSYLMKLVSEAQYLNQVKQGK